MQPTEKPNVELTPTATKNIKFILPRVELRSTPLSEEVFCISSVRLLKTGLEKAVAWIKTDMFKECIKSSCYMDLNQMEIDQLHFELDLEAIALHHAV